MFDSYVDQLVFDKTFSFDEDKTLMSSKVPFTMFPAKAMATFIQDVGEGIGTDTLNDIAYHAGLIVGDEFIEQLDWGSVPNIVKMKGMIKMMKVMGFGTFHMKKWNVTNKQVEVEVTKHPVIEWGKELYGSSERICGFYMAIYSAHIQKEFGIDDCWLKEDSCIAKGGDCCRWSYNM